MDEVQQPLETLAYHELIHLCTKQKSIISQQAAEITAYREVLEGYAIAKLEGAIKVLNQFRKE